MIVGERPSPLWLDAIPGLVVLSPTRKQTEQALGREPVNWPLHQLQVPVLFEFTSWFPLMMISNMKCKPNKPFPPQSAFWPSCFITATEILTKTECHIQECREVANHPRVPAGLRAQIGPPLMLRETHPAHAGRSLLVSVSSWGPSSATVRHIQVVQGDS